VHIEISRLELANWNEKYKELNERYEELSSKIAEYKAEKESDAQTCIFWYCYCFLICHLFYSYLQISIFF